MECWFVRTNGETGHNQRGTMLFIAGEPPNYPNRAFNYRLECLKGGFIRIGWPASGDLRSTDWRITVRSRYGDSIPDHWIENLKRFANIRVGDVVVMPANREKFDVHFGIVVPHHMNPTARPGSAPYYYHYDTSTGDWYENAHRVPVRWHQDASGRAAILPLPALGGIWLKGFARIGAGRGALIGAAKHAGYSLAV